jgi:hypothetical protein
VDVETGDEESEGYFVFTGRNDISIKEVRIQDRMKNPEHGRDSDGKMDANDFLWIKVGWADSFKWIKLKLGGDAFGFQEVPYEHSGVGAKLRDWFWGTGWPTDEAPQEAKSVKENNGFVSDGDGEFHLKIKDFIAEDYHYSSIQAMGHEDIFFTGLSVKTLSEVPA